VSVEHNEHGAISRLILATAWFILFVPKKAVENTLKETIPSLILRSRLKLLNTPPEMDVPVDHHPVIVNAGTINDVRQGKLQLVTQMMTAGSMIPYVGIDKSETPYTAPIISYIAGVDEKTQGYVSGLIPAAVGK
jgi:hypothetical protein